MFQIFIIPAIIAFIVVSMLSYIFFSGLVSLLLGALAAAVTPTLLMLFISPD